MIKEFLIFTLIVEILILIGMYMTRGIIKDARE